MSLLLEALKKAERAKEEAQRRAREGDGDGAEAAEGERKPVVTRDNLPDISPTLEIASDDLGPAPAARAAPAPAAPAPAPDRPALELAPDPEPAPPPRPPRPSRAPSRPAATAASRQSEEQTTRAAARKVFEAKFREPNPKMPFYITLGALGVFAVGTVIYFWVQLRPPAPLVNLNPQRPPENAVAATETRPAPTPAPVAAAPAVAEGPFAGLPSATPARPSPAPEPRLPSRAQSAAAAPVAPAPRLAPRQAAAAPEPERIIAAPRSAPQVNPKVAGGYSAYQAGDLAAARADYEQALRDEPGNRDALLGLAALDVRSGRYESAEALYLRVLQVDPRDPQAQAALIALRSARADPLVTESRVKSLLAADPGAHALNFALGNQLAQQNRWAEAQQEYFKAYAAEPDNADFAYNLAVSLDHLRQPKAALEYYQRAIALGAKSGASFDLRAARERAAQLAR